MCSSPSISTARFIHLRSVGAPSPRCSCILPWPEEMVHWIQYQGNCMNSVVCVTQNIGLNDGKVISDLQISKFQRMTFFESW